MASRKSEASGISFGARLRHTTTRKLVYSVTEDKKAFDIRFATALAAGVGSPSFDGLGNTKPPIGTRVYAAVIPASGKNVKASLALNGFFVAEPGTSVTLLAVVNDQTSVHRFAETKKLKDLVLSLPVRAKVLSEIRLTLMLIAQRDDAHPDASALIAIGSIEADTFVPRKPKAAKSG